MFIVRAEKSDKKAIKRFYKQNRYSAGFMGDDVCFYITDEYLIEQKAFNEEAIVNIIACVIISYQHDHPFLHGLLVAQTHKRKGHASSLLNHCKMHFKKIFCFVEPRLLPWYAKQKFVPKDVNQLPEQLKNKLSTYQQYTKELVALNYIHCS